MRFGWFGRKGEVRPPLGRLPVAFVTGWAAGEAPKGYEALTREGYLRNPVGQRAVRLVAEGAGSAALFCRPEGHPAETLLRRPNPAASGAGLIEAVASHLLLHGNAYLEVVTGAAGEPAELHVLRPERVAVEADARGWPAGYRYRAGDASVRLAAESVLHLKGFHPLDDHYGLGCLGAAAGAIEAHNAAAKWNKALLDNAARPSGALIFETGDGEALAPDQFANLKRELEACYQGAANAGRPLVLEGGLKWQPLSLTPAEMDFVEARGAAAREIALAFGVPPMLLGLPGDNTYANYSEANRALWRLTIAPLLGKICAGLTGLLQRWWPEVAVDVDWDAVPALSADRERLWAQVSAAEFLSDDEKRAMLGFEARGGA